MITKMSTAALLDLLCTTLDELDERGQFYHGPDGAIEPAHIDTAWGTAARSDDEGWRFGWYAEPSPDLFHADYGHARVDGGAS